jgi:hypothetical protein
LSRIKTLGLGFTASTLATLALAAGAAAVASSPITVSFAASSNSSAGWTHHHHAFKLHVAGNASKAFAVVKLHNFSSKLPKNAPSFDASFSQSGTPRWYIKFANGDYLFGYPDIGAWETHPTYSYGTYAQERATLRAQSGGTLPKVTKVDIVADGSSAPPYTTIVSNVVYGSHHVTP